MAEYTGIIFDLQRFSVHNGPGIRTTVFLKGCPLRCLWCHNPEGIAPQPAMSFNPSRCLEGCRRCVAVCPRQAIEAGGPGVRWDTARCGACGECARICPAEAFQAIGRTAGEEELWQELLKDRPFYDQSGGGVTFSGGEPLAQAGFLLPLLRRCRREGLHSAVDTCGFVPPEIMEEAARWTGLFLYDIKGLDPEAHQRATGQSNELILENLRLLVRLGAPVWIRLPVIPGLNDSLENARQTAAFLRRTGNLHRIHLLPFHPVAGHKYSKFKLGNPLEGVPRPAAARLEALQAIYEQHGFHVITGG